MKYIVTLKDKTYEVEVEEGEAMILDEYEAKAPAAPAAAAPVAAAPAAAPAAAAPAAPASGTAVPAPLPGNVLSIKVNQGDSVAEGDVLLVIEAMKMENEVAAPCAGTVQQISVSVGQMVNTGDTLVVL
ncbi:MAG: biotin/lipoyl-binding protein [Coriobacteriaceae bacterium]|nr:biotin/lipoyl-binding protein [Coriobacteriaceae bacterium]